MMWPVVVFPFGMVPSSHPPQVRLQMAVLTGGGHFGFLLCIPSGSPFPLPIWATQLLASLYWEDQRNIRATFLEALESPEEVWRGQKVKARAGVAWLRPPLGIASLPPTECAWVGVR